MSILDDDEKAEQLLADLTPWTAEAYEVWQNKLNLSFDLSSFAAGFLAGLDGSQIEEIQTLMEKTL